MRWCSHNILNRSKWNTYDEDINKCFVIDDHQISPMTKHLFICLVIDDEPVYHIIFSCFFFPWYTYIIGGALEHDCSFVLGDPLWILFFWLDLGFSQFVPSFSFWLGVLFTEVCSGFINWKFYKFENNIKKFIQSKLYLRSKSKVIPQNK